MALGRNLFPIFIVRSLLILTLSLVSVAQVLENCDNGYGNYTKGSRYEANLNNLLSSLHSHIDPFGFANSTSSSGEGDSSDDDPAYALFLCRGDIDHDSCTKCVNDTVSKLTTTCPGYKQASGTYDGCMLRYSNRSLTGSVAANIFLYMKYPVNATNVAQFNQELGALMTDLRTKASKGGSSLKFAAANKTISDFQTLYGLVQCTPDLTEQQCNNCLLDRIAQIPDCCAGNTMGGVFAWSCYMQFQTSPFYNETRVLERLSPPPPSPGQGSPPPIPSPPPHLPEPAGNNNTNQSTLRRIVAISISTVVGFILIIFLCFIVISRRSKKHKKKKMKKMAVMSPDQKPDSSMNDDTSSTETMQYEFKTIQEATDDFSDANRLGHGGFGVVYKGKLSHGKEIAVKRLAEGSEQGKTEFKNEIVLMSRLNHRNLTKLLGFCLQGKERLIVYEFLPNRSLDHFIFHPVRRMLLNWETRYNIIVGVARGLVYLHEGSSITIIHHDLKASNVLLDEKMNPRISDFGMARLFTVDKSLEITKKIAGTYGYMAPEFAYYGQYSIKTDVFSFGVLILEIVTGRKNSSSNESESSSSEHLLSYVWKKWRKGKMTNIIDKTISEDGSRAEKLRCIHIGLLCVQKAVSKRPTMAAVMLMLNSYTVSMLVPSKPGFLMDDDVVSTPSPPDKNDQTINHVSFTDPYPR